MRSEPGTEAWESLVFHRRVEEDDLSKENEECTDRVLEASREVFSAGGPGQSTESSREIRTDS